MYQNERGKYSTIFAVLIHCASIEMSQFILSLLVLKLLKF